MDITRNDVETLTQPLVGEVYDLDGGAVPVPTELTYSPADPFAVTMCFRTGTSGVRWTFARDLLEQGLEEPSGDGDVHVWPCLDDEGRAVVIVELCAPAGSAMVGFSPEEVAAFVDRSLELVPAGTEGAHLDLDTLVADLLGASEEP